ncbi:endonuclease Q family protein [Paenibacillus chartarius]|uniref:Endonuclease Q family protein n=1 Tax=Paenibacillus chartarius TaxID=747481 RepID=A0ABV6DNN5_9BACL
MAAEVNTTLRPVFADLHIHIGRTETGTPVKITGARDLTFFNIAKEASERKGIELIGIIDCHSPAVQREIDRHLDSGDMVELEDGGIRYRHTTVLLGSEIEVRDPGMQEAHVLAYMPTLAAMKDFTAWMSLHMTNVELSTQRIRVPARILQDEVLARGGILIPAHVFTPHKGIYGSVTDRMENLLDLSGVAAVELGLSADSMMAGLISELDPYTFVTNSDAHSLGKIGREYNELLLAAPSFKELRMALARRDGRRVAVNYGLNPRLGKYHRSYCEQCEEIVDESERVVQRCAYCGSTKLVRGVMDRILHIADRDEPVLPPHRPPYRYQVPLEFIPKLGKRTLDKLLNRFGTEMNIIHHASGHELAETAGESVAKYIVLAREGKLETAVGGGGKYGRVIPIS